MGKVHASRPTFGQVITTVVASYHHVTSIPYSRHMRNNANDTPPSL